MLTVQLVLYVTFEKNVSFDFEMSTTVRLAVVHYCFLPSLPPSILNSVPPWFQHPSDAVPTAAKTDMSRTHKPLSNTSFPNFIIV